MIRVQLVVFNKYQMQNYLEGIMEKEKLLNIKTNKRHSILEYLIKKYDPSQDMSRAAVFEREVIAGETVTDWKLIRPLLSNLEENDEAKDAPVFSNLQAKYSEDTEKILNGVRQKILEDLQGPDFKILQTQYMVLLLQANYLEILKKDKLIIKSEGMIDETDMNMPEITKTLCEMMLTDKDCNELKEIRRIMIEWRDRKKNIK